jgi:hypothetical protein
MRDAGTEPTPAPPGLKSECVDVDVEAWVRDLAAAGEGGISSTWVYHAAGRGSAAEDAEAVDDGRCTGFATALV